MRWADWHLTFRQRLATAVLLGAASVAAFAPLGWFPLIFLTLGGLFTLLDQTADENAPARQGALIGGAFGSGFFLAGISWIYVSLSTFGGMPALAAGAATVFFCLCMALYPALTGALFVRFSPTPGWRRVLFFAALWTLSEWLLGWVLTGFPWLAIGYSQTPPSQLAGFAPVLGVYGVSLLTAIVAAALYFRHKDSYKKLLVGIVALFIGGEVLLNIPWTAPQDETLRVALLQGNIPQDTKWRPEYFQDSLRAYHQLMSDNPAQLTVLPESALPVFFHNIPEDYLKAMMGLAAREKNGNLLFGTVVGDDKRYTNSAVNFSSTIGAQRYDKSHLVPFGEFIPPGFSWFMAMAHIPMSNFSRGEAIQAPIHIDGMKAAINICYEDAFGEEIIRALPEATLLINLSNVAWFGDSLAPAQHFQIARMRALETGRMMLRATNTGVTAIIGADGSVRGALPPFTRAALTGEVRAYTGSTPYVRWGNWPAVTISIILLAFARRRKALS